MVTVYTKILKYVLRKCRYHGFFISKLVKVISYFPLLLYRLIPFIIILHSGAELPDPLLQFMDIISR